jgi:hypothetical protein
MAGQAFVKVGRHSYPRPLQKFLQGGSPAEDHVDGHQLLIEID